MKIKQLLFGIFVILISCKKTDENFNTKEANVEVNKNKGIENLTFKKFKDSKWIIGEVGLNGEKPDTIIFNNPKTLTYISTDTGEEKCKYSFVKDTLVFTSYSTEFDTESDSEISCESINKFHFENNTFKYIFCYQKKETEKEFKCTNMGKYNLVFRKI